MSHYEGLSSFPDTFFGDTDKTYIDRVNADLTRLRGTDILYFVKRDQTRRIDGDAPGQDEAEVPPVVGLRKRSGGDLVGAMYGEPVRVTTRLDPVRRSVSHDWNYADPVRLRAIALDPSSDENPDERGTIYARTLRVDIAKVVADEVNIRPQQGDVIQLLDSLEAFFDVEDVSRTDSRFGGDGTFHVFQCMLAQSSKFFPFRKILPGGLGHERL